MFNFFINIFRIIVEPARSQNDRRGGDRDRRDRHEPKVNRSGKYRYIYFIIIIITLLLIIVKTIDLLLKTFLPAHHGR